MIGITPHCGVAFINYHGPESVAIPMNVDEVETPAFLVRTIPWRSNATIGLSSEWYWLSHLDRPSSLPPASKLFQVRVAFVLTETGGEHLYLV
ncbi:unnamed protein product [Linum tenue]|uniref:Uncharacterized protein n=1 Tax=Linum tenue TaxID=586396 RepID=A0AAV0MG77_9ROSI|nr:unnamed protein product [Linum tenue]